MSGPVETTPYAAGVWVVYGLYPGPTVQGIYRTELEARRAAPDYESVDFVAFGVDVPEALR